MRLILGRCPFSSLVQYVGRFFASEARKSCHHFGSPEQESAALIYNYSPTYTLQITNGSYEQIYFFGG